MKFESSVGEWAIYTVMVVFISFVIGLIIGSSGKQRESEALKLGLAERVLVDANGSKPTIVFQWKTNLVK
jgi:hypothetical protein